MALRCFAKCPYRAHRWDIRQGAQEGLWRYCGKLPIRGPNHHQLGPYEPGTLAGSAHQVNGYPKPAIYRVKLESRLITEDDMLPVGHCQVPPPLRPLQAETTVVGSQQGLRCGSICPVTTGQESVVNRCATSPHSVQIFSSAPSRPEHSRNDPVGPASAMHGLAEVLSFGEPLKTCLAPKIQWQHAFWVCGWR